MGEREALRALIDGAYAAALDESRWQPWTEQVKAALGGVCASFNLVDRQAGAFRQRVLLHDDLRALDSFVDSGLERFDPQLPFAIGLPAGRVYQDTDHAELTGPDATDYIAWMKGALGMQHYVSNVVFLDRGMLGGISVFRSIADGATPVAARRVMEAIFPDFAGALRLGFQHAGKLAAAEWDGRLAAQGDPALLLGEDGGVIRLNAAADALFRHPDGLALVDGRVRIEAPDGEDHWRALTARAVRRAGPRAGMLGIRRPSGRRPYVVSAYPMARSVRMLAPVEAAALVIIVDPSRPRPLDAALIRAAFDLTPREADVAVLLVTGHSVESAAAMLGVSLATARVHMRRLLAKTGSARQADLLLLLTRLHHPGG